MVVAGRSKNVGMPIAMLLHTDGAHERPGGKHMAFRGVSLSSLRENLQCVCICCDFVHRYLGYNLCRRSCTQCHLRVYLYSFIMELIQIWICLEINLSFEYKHSCRQLEIFSYGLNSWS